MPVNFDKEQLEKLAKNFYNLSRTMISIYDSDYKILFSYPNKMCDFCSIVRESEDLTKRCLEHDRAAFKVCKKTRSLYMYHCHMGLLEVAFPIISNNIIIGYMLFGQICDLKDKTPLIKNIVDTANEFDLDKDALLAGLQKVKYRSPEYISSISNLMEMSANYIWLNNIMDIKSTSLAYSIGEYINFHLTGDLSIAKLCNVFGISRSSLYNLSIEHFGCGISDYVTQRRICEAKKILSQKGINIAETAEAVGFQNVDNFIRRFKKHTGITPKQYQKNNVT